MADDLKKRLEDLVAKIDGEGLDYFLTEYGGMDMIPTEYKLRSLALTARVALQEFEATLEAACSDHGVEYE